MDLIFLRSLIIFIVLVVSSTFSCNEFKKGDFNSSEARPKMHVHSNPGNVKIVENTVWIERVGVPIRIDCFAPFPIDFEFHGHLSNREATVYLKRTAPNYTDVSTFCFHINVTVNSYEEMTGEYTCFPVQHRGMKTSYYIYSAAHPPETLLNRGQNIIIEPLPESDWVTIPCATSNPNVTVHLFSVANAEKSKISVSENVKYDPKIGFTIRVHKDLWGKFQCRTDLSESDVVQILIQPPKGFLVKPPEQLVILKEGDILKLSCESVEDISILYEKNIPMSEVLGRPRHDAVRKLQYFLQFQSGILKSGDSGTVTCVRKSDNHQLHQWLFQVREAAKNSKYVKTDGFNPSLCNGNGGPNTLTLFGCNNWIECKMRKCQRRDRTCQSIECKDSQTFNCLTSGILQCYNKQNENSQDVIYFPGLEPNSSYTRWITAPKKDILKIQKFVHILINNSTGTVADVKFVCEGSTFVFAVGFKWFLLNFNGIQSQISEENVKDTWRSFKSKNVIKSTARINISNQVKTIICKAPVWNSTEWEDDMMDLTDLQTSQLIGETSSSTNRIYYCVQITSRILFILSILFFCT